MTPIEVKALRAKLWQNGFRPVAVYSDDATDWANRPIANRGKRPKGEDWPERARKNPPEASTAEPTIDALNTGVLCDGLTALDLDIDNAAIASQALAEAQRILGAAPIRTRSDSARVLLLYRAAEGEPSKQSIKGPHGKVEALGHGNQFVAFGNHPDGAAYVWPQGAPDGFHRDALTAVTQEALMAFLCAVAPLVGADVPALLPAPLAAHSAVSGVLTLASSEVTDRERRYGAEVREQCLEEIAALKEGERNDRLNKIAGHIFRQCGAGRIDTAETANQILNVALSIGLPKDEAERTIKSAMEHGLANPAEPLPALDIPQWIPAMLASWIEAYKAKHSQASKSGKRRVNLVRMDSIEESAVSWLWEGFLPKGCLTLLGGEIQAGKSTIAMSLAAIVTTGGFWPDGSRCITPGKVIFWSSEEIVESVVKPRLMVAGADVSRILTIESSLDEKDQPCAFDPAQDIPLLRDEILNLGQVSLVIIDPLISAVAGDTNKANDVRRSLQPIVTLAEEFNCTVLGIHHVAKNSQGKSTNDRMLGSQAFAAMARVVLAAAKDEDSDNRVFAISKSNISKDNGGFNYSIEGVSFASPKGEEIKTSRVLWGKALEGSSRRILSEVEGEPNQDSSKLGQAKQFLLQALSPSPVGARELIRNAREGFGISEKTLRRAQNALGIRPEHDPIFDGGWKWSLPLTNQLNEARNRV